MTVKQRKKICWNCDGSVPVEEENCSFCGVYLSPLESDEDKNSLFSPPYRLQEVEEEADVPPAPYATAHVEAVAASQPIPEEPLVKEPSSYTLEQRTLFSLSLILSGAVFLIFGLALLLFSRNGILTLSWDATLWFLYIILAIPLLVFGCRYLGKQ